MAGVRRWRLWINRVDLASSETYPLGGRVGTKTFCGALIFLCLRRTHSMAKPKMMAPEVQKRLKDAQDSDLDFLRGTPTAVSYCFKVGCSCPRVHPAKQATKRPPGEWAPVTRAPVLRKVPARKASKEPFWKGLEHLLA